MAPESTARLSTIGTGKIHWFFRGLAIGVMLQAALNAVSYFFRSSGISDLVGITTHRQEALGFPAEIWREGMSYPGGSFVNFGGVGLNLAIGLVIGGACGGLLLAYRNTLNRWVAEFESQQAAAASKQSGSWQFSVKSMLVVTLVVAILVALLTQWSGSWQALAGIYLIGPCAVIGIAMFPQGLHWKIRAALVAFLSTLLIGVALYSGSRLGMDLDRVMLGFFICWTPQSVFASLIVGTGEAIMRLRNRSPNRQALDSASG